MSFGEYTDTHLADHEASEPAGDRVEIPLSYAAISLGFSVLLLAFAGAWWSLSRDSWLSVVILASAAALVSYLLSRFLSGRGPGLILSSAGVSVRKGLGDVP